MAAVAVACGSSTASDPTATPSGNAGPRLDVVTTIYPVTYFAERIGGDRVQVTSIIRPGVEAHDFEPTPGDILEIADADVLIYTHPSFEGWIEDAVESAGNNALVAVETADLPDDAEGSDDHGDESHADEHGHDEEKELVDGVGHVIEEVEAGEITADEGIGEIEELLGGHGHEGERSEGEHGEDEHVEELKGEILELIEQVEGGQLAAEDGIEQLERIIGGHAHEDDHDDHGHDDDGHGHDHGGVDPHVWLNPIEATEQVRAIQAAFSAADSAGADLYESNANALVAELLALDSEIGDALASCTLDHIVVSHEAYGHLAERYALEQIGLADLSAEFESTPRRIADIIEQMQDLEVTHILQEPILSDDLAETVASETGAEILPLHPLESLTPAELEAGEDYFNVMRANLASLKTALDCS